MQRLYIGGLTSSVSQKDLKDRFGKFGDVQDVELRSKRDEEGVPFKTFAYININISDADLKKCMTVLNKSKWKGGTLQIETAKECFLHRLAQERQASVEQSLQQPAVEDKRQKMLDSLSKAGVDNFTMKAAVPGTEIPGHKDWVVSKFGRVLPVLQLKCKKGHKARTLKYDPSKYSHNIRKINQTDADTPTPVTQLTWEVQGGDDDISKKRRGEFPPYQPPRPKRRWTDMIDSHKAADKASLQQKQDSVNHTEPQQFTNNFEPHTNYKPAQMNSAALYNDDDSDEEIQRMKAPQNNSHDAPWQDVDDGILEVVGFDYLAKTGRPGEEDENGYDSADTDELFASRKPPPPEAKPQEKQPPTETNTKKGKTKKKSTFGEEEEDAEEEGTRRTSSKQQSEGSGKLSSQKQDCCSEKQSRKSVLPAVKSSSSESDTDEDEADDVPESDDGDDEEDEEDSESSESCSDSDYEAMFSNVTCMEISFADLQRLAEESQQNSEPAVNGINGDSPEKEPAKKPAPKKGITPEEILASIMEGGDSSGDEKKKKKKKKRKVQVTPLPAFQGTKALSDKLETDDEQNKRKEKGKEDEGVAKKDEVLFAVSHVDSDACEEKEEEREMTAAKIVPNKALVNTETSSFSSSGDDDDDDDDEEVDVAEGEKLKTKVDQTVVSSQTEAKALSSPCSSSTEDDEDSDDEVISAGDVETTSTSTTPRGEEEEEEEEKKKTPLRVTLGAKDEEELQRKANLRRLAAVQQRVKEAEENKRLIQGALANLDAPKTGKGKHIVFGSDNDDDEDEDEVIEKKTLFQEDSQTEDEATGDEASANDANAVKEKARLKPSGHQLFGGSEDEEEDGGRFEIRPQFEGRAGQKLMELQSRFGADERFRMDSRFLEEDEGKEEDAEGKTTVTDEEASLEEEKKKNLSILQSVLGTIQPTSSSKMGAKAKTFRDVSALHYDPSKEEHAAFENKQEETKESKSARKKKREESQKLPEVSKEMYYDVSGDLKAVFGQTKKDDVPEGEEKAAWDQEEEEEKIEEDLKSTTQSTLISADHNEENQESGFKFSFFGDDAAETESRETEYKVETIQAPKVSWQQDPRFQDSSSEEDEEEEQEEEEEESGGKPETTEEATPSKTSLFFFHPEDNRLTEGPRLFCCTKQLEEQREQWEERRTELRQEYRKKHKDARRKLKTSMKS